MLVTEANGIRDVGPRCVPVGAVSGPQCKHLNLQKKVYNNMVIRGSHTEKSADA